MRCVGWCRSRRIFVESELQERRVFVAKVAGKSHARLHHFVEKDRHAGYPDAYIDWWKRVAGFR